MDWHGIGVSLHGFCGPWGIGVVLVYFTDRCISCFESENSNWLGQVDDILGTAIT